MNNFKSKFEFGLKHIIWWSMSFSEVINFFLMMCVDTNIYPHTLLSSKYFEFEIWFKFQSLNMTSSQMIWGGPIFSWATRWWWQRMNVGDNLVSPMNSPRLNPDGNATALKPCRIFMTPQTCARSQRPRNGSLQSTNSQWNNRSH
jgi:hypothetical protein